MRAQMLLATGAAVLTLGMIFLPGGRADDDKDLKAALEKLVKTAADKPEDVRKAGADFAKANKIDNEDIKDVMDFLGKRDVNDKKGLGWGVGKPGAIKSDGIELKLRELAKGKMSKAQLEKESEALVEVANRIAAIGSVSLACPPRKAPAKFLMDWKQWSEDMIESSRDLAKAVQSKDPEGVKKAADRLNHSCKDCHR
jgi:Cytochrome C'